MARTELTKPEAYTPDGVRANYDANIDASNANFEELYGVETQVITTTPADVTMPIVVLNYSTTGDKIVNLPAVANTTLRRVNITKVCADTSTATITARTNEYLDGAKNGTLAMTALGLSVTFQVIDGKWVSDWVGKNAGAPDGQNVNFKPGGTDKHFVFQTDVAAGGKLKIVDTTGGITDEYPTTWIQANLIGLSEGSSYIAAKLKGRSDGALVVHNSSAGSVNIAADTGVDLIIGTDAGNTLKLKSGTYVAELSADSSGRLVSASGFAGSGAGLTNVPDSALSSNVALQDGDNTFTGNNSFTGSLSFDGLAIASGKTLTVSKTMTLTSSDDTSVITLPAGTKTLASTDGSVAGLASGSSTFTYDANDGHWITADVVKARRFSGTATMAESLANGVSILEFDETTYANPSWATPSGLYAESNIETLGYFVGDGSLITGIADSALSSNVPLLNAANAFTNANTYQPGAAYDTATLGAERLDDTTWTLNSGWTYVSGTDWTQGFVHSGAITAVNATPTNGGTGYTLNDVLTVTTGDGTATVTATGVSGGVVTAVTLTSGGTTGYRGGTGQATSGGTGNGCTVNVTAIAGGTGELTHSDTPTIGANYHIAFTVSDYVGSGYFTVTYGGESTISQSGSGTFGVKAVTATGLSIAPSTNFSGTIVISIKPVTPYNPAYTLKDGSGGIVVEGRSSVSSLKNQYVGYCSGQLTTTGNGNTAFGYSALETVSTGTTNTAVGALALQALSGGLANTAVGYNAGSKITSGVHNLLLGAFSGGNLTSGRYNVAIGPAALDSATSTWFNVALGYQSSLAVAGSNNVSIGAYSLKSATGSGNISIGHYSGGYATGSNEFYVNNKDQGNALAEKANSLLYGVMGANAAAQTLQIGGKLKIDPVGTAYSAPTEALDVAGNIKASGGVTANTFPLIQWRGSSASDPTENLSEGQMYWNTSGTLKIYTGSAWVTVGVVP